MKTYECISDELIGFVKGRMYFSTDKADNNILVKNDRGQAVWKDASYFKEL